MTILLGLAVTPVLGHAKTPPQFLSGFYLAFGLGLKPIVHLNNRTVHVTFILCLNVTQSNANPNSITLI